MKQIEKRSLWTKELVIADVANDKQVQEVLNKVAHDYKNDKLDSLRVPVSNLVGEAKGTFNIAFSKSGMAVDEVGMWVPMP